MCVSVNKKTGRRGLMVLTMAAGAAAAMLPPATRGADIWDNSSGDGKWSTATNWADDTEPTLADAVIFPTPAPGGIANIISAPSENAFSLTFNDIYNINSTFQVGSVNLAPGGLITVAANQNVTINKLNSDGVTKEGGGTLFLTTPTLTGTIAINAGTLEADTLSNIGPETVPITLGLGGTLLIGGNLITARTITTNGGSIAVDIAKTLTVNGALGAGSGALTLDYGQTVFNAASTRTGTTNITGAASARLNNASALGTGTITNQGSLTLPGVTLENNLILDGIAAISTSGMTTCNGTVSVTANAGISVSAGASPTDVFTIGNAPNDLTGGAVSSTITVAGTGKLLLAQSSDFVGKWVVESGTVEIADDNRLGNTANSITLSGGTFSAIGTFSSSRSFIPNGGSLSVSADNNLTLTAALAANNKALVKSGPGQLTLTVNSTRSGNTAINGGTLRVQSVTAFGTGSLGTVINGGALEVGGITLDKSMTLNNGATLRGTGATAVSNGTATVASGAAITLATGTAASDVLTLGNAANDIVGGGGGSTINIAGAGKVMLAQSTTYTGNWGISGGATLQVAADNRLGNAANNVTLDTGGTFSASGTFATNRVFTLVAPAAIGVTSGNTFTLNSALVSGLNALTKVDAGTLVLASANTYSGGTTIDAGTVQLGNGTGSAGSFGTGAVLNNGAIVTNFGGTAATVANDISGAGSFTKNGGGVVTRTGANTYTGGTTVNSGTLISANGFKGGGAISIADNSRAVISEASPNGYDPDNNIYPSGSNASGSKVGSLTITGSGVLDLGNSDLAIDHAGTSPLDDIVALLQSGFNGGGWDGAGIISNTLNANNPNQLDPSIFGLGYAENIDLPQPYGMALGGPLFNDFEVDDTTLLVKFTWAGDLNLDGFVDFQDLSVFNTNYDNGTSSGRYWFEGDFNYDGFIDFQDLSLFNTNYDPNKPSLPEPGTTGLLAGAAALGLRPRRRRVEPVAC